MKSCLGIKIKILILLLFILLTSCSNKDKVKENKEQLVNVSVKILTPSSIELTTNQTGIVKPVNEAKISSKILGKINNIYVDEGAYVKKGQILATLDQTDIIAQLNQAKMGLLVAKSNLTKVLAGSRTEAIEQAQANLNQAKVNLESAETNYLRMQELYNKGIVSKQSYETAETQFKVAKESFKAAKEQFKMIKIGPTKEDINIAKSQVKQAEATLNTINQQLKNTYIYSPFNGVIASKSVNLGEVVNPAMPLFTLVDMNNVKVRVDISETLLSYFYKGKSCNITFDAYPNLKLIGKVINISPVVNPQSHTFSVDIIVNNLDHKIKPGMFAKVQFILDKRSNVLTVPIEAILDKGEDKHVYLIKDNKAFLSSKLKLGISNNSEVEVLEGLKLGDTVVIKGKENLIDGIKVNIIK